MTVRPKGPETKLKYETVFFRKKKTENAFPIIPYQYDSLKPKQVNINTLASTEGNVCITC